MAVSGAGSGGSSGRGHRAGRPERRRQDHPAADAGRARPARGRLDHPGSRRGQRRLPKFGLRAAHVDRRAGTLSPGERTRAALALLQARGVNLLVLDEPTNHLDLPAIEQLEQALDSYTGTLLLVSHDRRLTDAVRVTRRIAVDAGTVTVS